MKKNVTVKHFLTKKVLFLLAFLFFFGDNCIIIKYLTHFEERVICQKNTKKFTIRL